MLSKEHPVPAAREKQTASLSRRLSFAGDVSYLFDRLGTWGPVARFAVLGDWPMPRILTHLGRVGFDLFECLRTASLVPNIGDVEAGLLDVPRPLPQHPRYLAYWYDVLLHSMVGMHIGVDLIRHQGKYYVIENNHGPSIYSRRRELYDSPFDPLVSGIVSTARTLGFTTVVPIAFRWSAAYVDEFERAGREHGIEARPSNCPLAQPGGGHRLVALPWPLPPKTMYVIHAGLWTPVTRFVDNKWSTSRWLARALESELPGDSLLALPPTHDRLTFPLPDHGPQWPNLVIKLAGSARSCHVIAARFEDEAEARRTLGLNGLLKIPRKLRLGFAKSLLFGGDRVIYQSFIPLEVDEHNHTRTLRLHLLVSPLRTTFLSAHYRVSRQGVPERAPRGIIRRENAFIFNEATYAPVSPEIEDELRLVAQHLGQAMQRAIRRTFETGSQAHTTPTEPLAVETPSR